MFYKIFILQAQLSHNIFLKLLIHFLVGVIIFISSFFFIWKNEHNLIKDLNLNNFILKNTMPSDISSIDQNLNDKLIHIKGQIAINNTIIDELGVEVSNSLLLNRTVLIYQWQETSISQNSEYPNLNTTEQIKYKYSKIWSEDLINSSNFAEYNGHQNPNTYPIASKTFYAKDPKLGEYNLTRNQISLIRNLPIEKLKTSFYKSNTENEFKKYNSENIDSISPEIGDIKIEYSYVLTPINITIIGKQNNHHLFSHKTENEKNFFYISTGLQSLNDVVNTLNMDILKTTWNYRILFIILMFTGLMLIIKPIYTAMNLVPIVGYLFNLISIMLIFFLTVILSTLTIAIAWFRFRPFLSLILIITAILLSLIYNILINKNEILTKNS